MNLDPALGLTFISLSQMCRVEMLVDIGLRFTCLIHTEKKRSLRVGNSATIIYNLQTSIVFGWQVVFLRIHLFLYNCSSFICLGMWVVPEEQKCNNQVQHTSAEIWRGHNVVCEMSVWGFLHKSLRNRPRVSQSFPKPLRLLFR